MKEVEKILENKKIEIDQLEVPANLEERLRNALETKKVKNKSKKIFYIKAASFFVMFILVGIHFNTLAYYGKRLIGYDEIMGSTLKQLNELGKGQIINKTYEFSEDISMTLDGIMLDDNQLIVFYTLKNSKGRADEIFLGGPVSIKGFFREYIMRSSVGIMEDSNKEIKYICKFDPPSFLEKTFKLKFTLQGAGLPKEGEIEFVLDRNKAMGYTLKKEINKTIQTDSAKVKLKTISASPTSTIIKGEIQNIIELGIDQIKGERLRPDGLELQLIANGKEVAPQGSGMSTDMKGITFHFEYDALPKDVEDIRIKMTKFRADYDVDSEINLEGKKNIASVHNQDIEILDVYESKGDTYVTIRSEESVLLSKVNLVLDDEKIELENTIKGEYEKEKDGIFYTRTLHFKGSGKEKKLHISHIAYTETYNEEIKIPID